MADVIISPKDTNAKIENLRTSSLSDRKFSAAEIGAALLLSTGIYLLNGEYGATACNLLTTVPAAIFTYKVLTQTEVSKAGYKSVLFYWTVLGGMSLLDAVLDNSYGYFLVKFVLLAAVFGNATTKNQEIWDNIISIEGIKTEITQCVTSIVTQFDSEGYPIHSPPPTAFSEDFTDAPKRSCAVHSEPTSEEDDMMSTQRDTPEGGHTYGVNRALTPHPDLLLDFAAAAESAATVAVAYGDLVTNPMENVVFGLEETQKTITMVNVSGENAMWALKCNALHRLGATPACGVILSGGKQEIRVVLHGERGANGNDKLAIDYATVGRERLFRPGFFDRSDKKRHLLRVNYQ